VAARISIPIGDHQTTALVYSADARRSVGATLVLAHGAGAGQTSRFMVDYAQGLAARGIDVVTFNFLYTEQGRKVPDRPALLEGCFRAAIDVARRHRPLANNRMFIGGKSMGGRIASHLVAAGDAAPADISGLVMLGYPLHPPGKPDQLRVEHLPNIRVPVLVLQGERDTFGSAEELRPYLSRSGALVTIHAVDGGDHSLAVRHARAQADRDRHHGRLQDVIASWIGDVAERA
jgi:predicted alpha/beta-hydrolase family hydrolase